jgi:hypothetical protein
MELKKKIDKKKQRMWQVFLALVLVVMAVLIESVGMHPKGIYVYRHNGYQDFRIGLSKEQVLRQINLQKTIRGIKTCDPASMSLKSSRRKLEMTASLSGADTWICHDRTGKDYLFVFMEGRLNTLLVQRLRFGKTDGSPLFAGCRPDLTGNLDHYLETGEALKVFVKD